jgi:cardiolipin synthase A/B
VNGQSIDVTSGELKDRAALSALDKAARRGVNCRIVLTDNPACANAVAEVSEAGCSVHLFPDNKTGLYMHEKIMLIDHTALIIGSQNLTTTSLLESRELSVALDINETGRVPWRDAQSLRHLLLLSATTSRVYTG